MVNYLFENKLETPSTIPNLFFVGGYFTNKFYLVENVNKFVNDTDYQMYELDAVTPSINDKDRLQRKYKRIGNVRFNNNNLESIENCLMHTEGHMCTTGLFNYLYISKNISQYYTYNFSDSICWELSPQTPQTITKVKEIEDLVRNEDKMSPVMKYKDRCINNV